MVPPGIIPVEQMIEVMTDLELSDAASKLDILPENYKFRRDRIYLDVLGAHQTDTASFHKSLRFYTANPELLLKVYEGVEQKIAAIPVPE